MKVLATDYDDTLATGGVIAEETIAALQQFRARGNEVILVTGRILEDFFRVCPHHFFLDRIVAENGAVFYDVRTQKSELLCESFSRSSLLKLRSMGIQDLDFGRVMVSTSRPYMKVLQQWMDESEDKIQVISNRESLMILPSGIDKLTGLTQVLDRMNVSLTEVIGMGDAENDLSFLSQCGESIAVQNAIDAVKKIATHITLARAGEGVVEFLNHYLALPS